MMGTNGIDKTFLRVAKIQSFANGQPLTNATGFFYLQDDFLYLVTCRHVVINEATDHRPDRLQLSLHSDASDLQQRAELSIPLYVDGIPQWYQPSHGCNADVVAVSINDPHALTSHSVVTFCCDDILNRDWEMPLGQNVLILGFPLGFHDTLHNLPIVRSGPLSGMPEELLIDFGLNPQPMGIATQPVMLTQRVVVGWHTAKRLLHVLQLSVDRHESAFGAIETDVQKRFRRT